MQFGINLNFECEGIGAVRGDGDERADRLHDPRGGALPDVQAAQRPSATNLLS